MMRGWKEGAFQNEIHFSRPLFTIILPRAEVNPASPPAASVLGRVVFTVLRLDGTIQVAAKKVTRLTIISCLLLEHGWPVTRKLNM